VRNVHISKAAPGSNRHAAQPGQLTRWVTSSGKPSRCIGLSLITLIVPERRCGGNRKVAAAARSLQLRPVPA